MTEATTAKPFHLSAGGPFSRLMVRMHVLGDDRYHGGLRIALFLCLTWFPLFILSTLDGTLAGGIVNVPFLYDPNPQVLYLVVLPLLVAAEVIIDPLVGQVMQYLETSGLVPEEELPRYRAAVAEIARRRDSVRVESVLIALAVGMSWFSYLEYGNVWLKEGLSSWAWRVTGDGVRITAAGWFCLSISLPFLKFLIYRWLWRFGIWVSFLRRISQLRLALLATHSDRAGGLIILSRGQLGFTVLFTALAALMSSELVKEILYQGYKLAAAPPVIIGFVVFSVAALFGPLLFFTRQLVRTRRQAMLEYGALQYQLSHDFHRHWIIGKAKDLVDSEQPSAMADYNVVYGTVSSMHIVPLKPQAVILVALLLLVPFLPLLLTVYSITEILQRIASTFI